MSNIRAVVFDIGETLVDYKKPMDWSRYYCDALKKAFDEACLPYTDDDLEKGAQILKTYNTRYYPRDYEVTSDEIFEKILDAAGKQKDDIIKFKSAFYEFFSRESEIFADAEEVMKELYAREIPIGTLSDVAYGMDNRFALKDMGPIIKYVTYPYTSNDIGFRKPNPSGLLRIAQDTGSDISQVVFVGNELKDMKCAQNAGAVGVLINRDGDDKDYGQQYTIKEMKELLNLIEN